MINVGPLFSVVKQMTLIHCAKGPQICEQCKELAERKQYCLVDVYPICHGIETRPVKKFMVNGKEEYCEFIIVRTFENKKEGEYYANEHKLLFEV